MTRLVTEGWIVDDLELELRKLPGVSAAGFDEQEDILLIQLHVRDDVDDPQQSIPLAAARIAARYSHRPVAVEVVRWRPSTSNVVAPEPGPMPPAEADNIRAIRDDRTEARARLLAVLAFPETDELEVHLRAELNFEEEAHNAELIASFAAGHADLVVPEVIRPYVTERVLVLELVAGEKVTASHGLDPERARELARELFRFYVRQVTVAGVYHADPHRGNVLLTTRRD